jgi:hypothetical protein
VQLDIGGTLKFTLKGADMPHNGARWDSSPAPWCSLYHPGGGSITASASVTAGLSTALSAAATAGSDVIDLVSTTGCQRWRDYLVGPNASGQHEFSILDKVSTDTVTTLAPLKYTYAAGNNFKSHDLTLTLTSGWCATPERNCRAEWGFYIGGVKYKRSTIYHCSRYCPTLTIGEDDIESIVPNARRMISNDQRIGLILNHLWERVILRDISRFFNPSAIASGEAEEEAVIYKFRWYIAAQNKKKEEAEYWDEKYIEALDAVRESYLDLDESGGQSDDEIADSLMSRTILRC